MQPLPTFLVLGAQKSGTTSLNDLLSQHTDICMSLPKETHFFNVHLDKGLDYYRQTFFRNWRGEKAVGETTPPYLFLPYIPQRISETLPEVRMVVTLRNPVERAFSHWWMNTLFGLETLNFRDAIQHSLRLSFEDLMKAQKCERFYLQVGYYAEQLKRYQKFFPPKRFYIILSDRLMQDTEATLNEIYSFIGVVRAPLPRDTIRRHETLGLFANWLQKYLRRLSLDKLISPQMGYIARQFLKSIGDRPPTLDDEMRTRLTEHYRPYNKVLEELLKIDLRSWET